MPKEIDERLRNKLKQADDTKAMKEARARWYEGRTKNRKSLGFDIDKVLLILKALKKRAKNAKDSILSRLLKGDK